MSATEWMLSASIEEKPVRRKAMNFVIATPRFASSAATIGPVPTSVLGHPAILGSPGAPPEPDHRLR